MKDSVHVKTGSRRFIILSPLISVRFFILLLIPVDSGKDVSLVPGSTTVDPDKIVTTTTVEK